MNIEESIGLEKTWQWLYRVEHSPIWSLTNLFLTKEHFKEFVDRYNEQCPSNKIIEYGKAKITRRFKEPEFFLNERYEQEDHENLHIQIIR